MALPRKEARPEYSVIKALDEGNFLVQRAADNEALLGRAFDIHKWPETARLHSLVGKGAGAAATAVLNHANLVSIAGELAGVQFSGSGGERQCLVLFDYCDAGTLDNLLREPPVLPTAGGFLPESLCWHVLRGVLRALAWLHHGYRADVHMAAGEDQTPARDLEGAGEGRGDGEEKTGNGMWVMGEGIADPDWLPILHRDIRPENIYFQQPRGSETYGLCKLGNFGQAFVSGHANWLSGGPVVATKFGVPRLGPMKDRVEVEDVYAIPKLDRPYTRGSDLFALSAVLYRMMKGSRLPDADECPLCGCRHLDASAERCTHACHDDVDIGRPFVGLSDYTRGLKDSVQTLLTMHRGDDMSAAALVDTVEANFVAWRETTDDGKLYVDLADDLASRRKKRPEEERAETREAGWMSVGVV